MAEALTSEQRILLWDLDGTIIDSLGILEAGLGVVLPQHGLQLPPRDVLAANFHGSLEDSISNALGGLNTTKLASVVRDFLVVQDREYEVVESHIFPDALELARRAHAARYWQVLVTNRAHEGRLRASPRSIVANSRLRDYIDVVVCGDDSQHRKPNAAVLGNLRDRMQGAEVTVVGDQFVDAEFARNLGARAILVCRDGAEPAHMERLSSNWQSFVTVIPSLMDVEL